MLSPFLHDGGIGACPSLERRMIEGDARRERFGTVWRERFARYRDREHCVVLGRGYNYATAFEWSLKLKELTYVVAEPYSSADFQHGPIAIVEQGFPIMAVAPSGKVYESFLTMLGKLRGERVHLLHTRDVEFLDAQLVVLRGEIGKRLRRFRPAIRRLSGAP